MVENHCSKVKRTLESSCFTKQEVNKRNTQKFLPLSLTRRPSFKNLWTTEVFLFVISDSFFIIQKFFYISSMTFQNHIPTCLRFVLLWCDGKKYNTFAGNLLFWEVCIYINFISNWGLVTIEHISIMVIFFIERFKDI